MNRATLQQLAHDRVADAQALLAASRWPMAYYLAGYVVECALKACVLRHIDATGAIYQEQYVRSAKDFMTHDFDALVGLSDLTAAFGQAQGANPTLKVYWEVVKAWNVTSRYATKTELEARTLLDAITNDPDGVLRWLQQHW